MKSSTVVIVGISLICAATTAADTTHSDPFGYFGVYSLGDIGRPSAEYHSDFQGVAGAAGSVYFSSFSLDGSDSTTGYSLHTGGSATLTGAYHGSLEIGANANLGSLSVGGSVVAGGNTTNFSGGTIGGDAIAAGSVLLDGTMTVSGQKLSSVPYSPMADHAALCGFFKDTSTDVGAMCDTGGVTNQWGHLYFTGTEPVSVVTVGAATLRSAWAFTITAPADTIVYVNVPDATVNLDWTDWIYRGGVTHGDVMLNMPNATRLELTSANSVNILAPYADTTFPAGLVTGSLVVGDLKGGGQVNLGHFNHGGEVPEPATVLLLVLGGLGLAVRRRRK